jgi:hypothetical protein
LQTLLTLTDSPDRPNDRRAAAGLEQIPLSQQGDWLVMAAWLVL